MKNKNYSLLSTHYSSNKGFTLIELIISLAMVAILTGAVLQVARFSDTHKSLTLATDELRAALRTAQSYSLSIPNPEDKNVCGYGVYIKDGNNYEIFYTYVEESDYKSDPSTCLNDPSYRVWNGASANQKTIQNFKLPSELIFQTKVGESIFFVAPYGEVCDENGDFMVAGDPDQIFQIQNSGAAATREIKVNVFGKID